MIRVAILSLLCCLLALGWSHNSQQGYIATGLNKYVSWTADTSPDIVTIISDVDILVRRTWLSGEGDETWFPVPANVSFVTPGKYAVLSFITGDSQDTVWVYGYVR